MPVILQCSVVKLSFANKRYNVINNREKPIIGFQIGSSYLDYTLLFDFKLDQQVNTKIIYKVFLLLQILVIPKNTSASLFVKKTTFTSVFHKIDSGSASMSYSLRAMSYYFPNYLSVCILYCSGSQMTITCGPPSIQTKLSGTHEDVFN